MRALVVYESMFGNTEAVARAVGAGLAALMPTDVVEVGRAPAALGDDVDLLVVGGPTHAFGLSRRRTRADAAKQAEGQLVSRGFGLREWLAVLDRPRDGVAAAAFDTRVKVPLPGSAARAATRRLRRLGFRVAARPTTFWVTGTLGPLADGELDRARAWGEAFPVPVFQRR
ncbi:MAG TPA: flavodoxin domain-containing protein [Acidimicrobiales bacterium]